MSHDASKTTPSTSTFLVVVSGRRNQIISPQGLLSLPHPHSHPPSPHCSPFTPLFPPLLISPHPTISPEPGKLLHFAICSEKNKQQQQQKKQTVIPNEIIDLAH